MLLGNAWAAMAASAVWAMAIPSVVAQPLLAAVEQASPAMGVTPPAGHGSVMTIVDTAHALVQAMALPAEYGKARATALQVQIEGRGVPLLLPGGVQAASAMVQMQARCPSGVWAIERLMAYDGPRGTGSGRLLGASPSDQLLWNRLAGSSSTQPPGLLLVWLEQATNKLCASQKPPSRW